MPLTALDPKTALIVVDLQKAVAFFPSVHPMAEIVENAGSLAAAFRRHDLPVVLVNVTGGAPGRAEQGHTGTIPPDLAEFLPELSRQSEDHIVTKQTWGAFTGTDLEVYSKAASTSLGACIRTRASSISPARGSPSRADRLHRQRRDDVCLFATVPELRSGVGPLEEIAACMAPA